MLRNDVTKVDDIDVRNDVDDDVVDAGCVEVDLDVANLDDVEDVCDDIAVDPKVYVVVVAHVYVGVVVVADLLGDEVVGVDVIDVLGNVAVVVNLIDVFVDDVVYDDVDVDDLAEAVMGELLLGNDDVDDVDHLGDVVG